MVFAAATVATSLTRLLRGWLPSAGRQGRQDGPVGWQLLAHAVPGYTTVEDDLGFGFVSSAIPVDGPEHSLTPNRSLCETCAESQTRVAQ